MKSTKKKHESTVLDCTKPHRGTVEGWWKQEIDKNRIREVYGEDPGLGYIIFGTCIKHPIFGTSTNFHSSWVVKHVGNEIETRNSRYTLGERLGEE